MYNFPHEIIHTDDKKRYGHELYFKFNQQYQTKYEIAKMCNPSVIAEIGVRAGYGAYAMLSACPEALYYGFDNNRGKESGAKDLRFWRHASYILRNFNVYEIYPDFDSQQVDNLKIPEGAFVHVDGDHTRKGALHDLRVAQNSKARWILVDDILYLQPVFQAVNDFLEETYYRAEYYPDFRGEMLIYL